MADVGDRSAAIYAEGRHVAMSLMEDDSENVLESLLQHLKEFNEKNCTPPKDRGDIYQIAYRCYTDAAKKRGDESDLKRRVLERLSKHFHVHQEVPGNHWSGKRVRIDAIVIPRDDSGWKTKQPRLGIEFKNFNGFNPSIDWKDYTKWWAQCHDYAETDFDGHGLVMVFSYNGFSHYRDRSKSEVNSAFAERFWGRLGVGELRPKDLMFVVNGTNKIWSESRGVIDGARIGMNRKFGSR